MFPTFNLSARCEPGWSMFKGACYRFYQDEKDWDNAEKKCVQEGAHLASLFSDEEASFVRCLQDASSTHETWIGGKRSGNSFLWIDGSDFDYYNWKTGQPNNQGGNEDCIMVYSDPGQDWHEKWNDVPCDVKKNFVCKKKPVGGKLLSKRIKIRILAHL